MFGKYFYYAGQSSEDMHLLICGFDSAGEIPMGLSRDVMKGNMNKYRPVPNHMGMQYQDVLTFTLSVIKDPCYDEELVFTENELDEINAWLTSPDYPELFHMYNYDNEDATQYDYFGLFTDVQVNYVGDKIVGLEYTFTTNSPYAWTDTITQTWSCSGETTFDVNVNNSERRACIYPVVKIQPVLDTSTDRVDIEICSITDNNQSLSLNVPKVLITIDCNKSKITDPISVITFENLGIADVDFIYWPKLYHGTNQFKITGDCDITFEYREPRKVGAY